MILAVGCVLTTASCARRTSPTPPSADAPALLLMERGRHPASEPQDLYKAAYQACLGPEHDLGDRDQARARIVAEIGSLGDASSAPAGEPLLEPLVVSGAPEAIARVNLRPLRARGEAGINALLEAMFAARPASDAGRACLARTWSAMVPHLGEAGRALDASLAARGYPAVHHTEAYGRAYAPAYRIAPVSALARVGLAR